MTRLPSSPLRLVAGGGADPAKLRGGYILLFSTFETEDDWAPIVMHEYSHYLSAGQPLTQRRALADAFVAACPAALALPNPLNALEEPLAIYWGQYRFEQQVRGQALPVASAWYVQPHADRAAKALAAAFRHRIRPVAEGRAPVAGGGVCLRREQGRGALSGGSDMGIRRPDGFWQSATRCRATVIADW
jgi:hypothetical protein